MHQNVHRRTICNNQKSTLIPTNSSIFAIRFLVSSGYIFQMHFTMYCFSFSFIFNIKHQLAFKNEIQRFKQAFAKYLMYTEFYTGLNWKPIMGLLSKVSLDNVSRLALPLKMCAWVSMRSYKYCPQAYERKTPTLTLLQLHPNSQNKETLGKCKVLPRAVLPL